MTVNRRQFMQDAARTTAAAGAVMALAQTARAEERSPNEAVVVGVMGVNGRGSALTRVFASNPGARVAYICDVDERASAKSSKIVTDLGHAEPKQVVDFRKILDDKSVDVPQSLARPGDHLGLQRRQARVRGKALLPQPARRRNDG